VGTDYPWYDSNWLARYGRAVDTIRRVRPEALDPFEQRFEVFRTRPDFEVAEFEQVFSEDVLSDIRDAIDGLAPTELELHEVRGFGRYIVHDHPLITELQATVVDLVSEAAGERVEPCYNFVSLYTRSGVCPVHMDSPEAKWTLDLCVRQTRSWPIHVSQVVPWPELSQDFGDDWDEAIKHDPDLRFASYSLEPGGAILFAGSSQWHYRDPLPADGVDESCDLVFFHFVPEGTRALVEPDNWAQLFGIPELAEHTVTPAT
jgi:hypothetical protein